MKNKELQLLTHLRENSREKLTSVSKKTKIPISTLFDLLKELQRKIIQKATVLLDFDHLGFHTRAQVFLKSPDKDRLKEHLLKHPNVNTVHRINEGWNYVAEFVTSNNKELDVMLEKLETEYGVEKKEIHYIIEEVKREGFLFPSVSV